MSEDGIPNPGDRIPGSSPLHPPGGEKRGRRFFPGSGIRNSELRFAMAFLALIAASSVHQFASGMQDDKKPPPDPKPRIAMMLPLAVNPGATSKVTLRGLNLDQATEVKFAEPIEGASIAIKGKGKAELPKETDPAVYGDTKVDVEIKLPAGVEKVSLIAVNPAGATTPHE